MREAWGECDMVQARGSRRRRAAVAVVTVALAALGLSMAAGSAFAATASQQSEIIRLNSGANEDLSLIHI